MSIVQRLFQFRLNGRFAALLALTLAALILLPAVALANSPPDTPASVTVTRTKHNLTGYDTLNISGYGVTGASKYHITYSSDGGNSWTLIRDNVDDRGVSIGDQDANATFIVAVRAGNQYGWSGWRNSAPIAPDGSTAPPAAPGTISLSRTDGELTASWAEVASASKYHVTYSSNNGGSWNAAYCGDNCSTAATISVDNQKTYIVAVRAGNDSGWSGWTQSAASGPFGPQTPATPGPITVTRADGTLTATWNAVANADYYHINYSTDNKNSWQTYSSNYNQTTITRNVDNSKTYYIAVRAGTVTSNGTLWSGWRVSEASGPFGPQPPATPASVSVSRANGTLTASGYGVSNATKYHITYSADGGNSWNAAPCGNNCTGGASVTISGVDNAKPYIVAVRAGNTGGWSGWRNSAAIAPSHPPAPPAQVTFVRDCGGFSTSWTPSPGATGYDVSTSINNRKSWQRALSDVSHNSWIFGVWKKHKTYHIAVRARNSAGESGWTNSAAAHPPSREVSSLRAVTSTTHGTAGGSITTSWNAGQCASGYNVNYRADGGQWQRIQSGVSGTTHTGTVSSTGGYTVAVQAIDSQATSQWRNLRVDGWLTASGISGSGATLTLAGHSGDWYVKKTSPTPAGTCSAAISGSTHDLTGLSPIETYTYSAYSDSSCATLLATAAFTTSGVSVSNMSEASDGIGIGVLATNTSANGFTTGDHSSGYTLDRVVIKFRDASAAPGTFAAAIHAASGGNPATSATYTLSGSSTPTTAGDYAYTCSGTCSLNKETTYFLVLSGTSPNHSTGFYKWDTTVSASETNTPSNAGWSIANQAKKKSGNTWTDETDLFSGMFEVIASENPTLSAGSVTTSGAMLTIAGHTGDWYYKADKAPDSTCSSSAVTGMTKTLTGLSPFETYTYSAYSDSSCATLLATAAAFTTGGVSVSNLGETSDGIGVGVLATNTSANGFTTGDHDDGYTLDRVVIKFRDASAAPDTFAAAIHAASGGNPATSATYTLSGSSTPTTAGDYAYTCSGTCSLNKETTYFLVLSGTSPNHSTGFYKWDTTVSANETNTPSNAGWSIANQAKKKSGNTWTDETSVFSGMFEVVATEK